MNNELNIKFIQAIRDAISVQEIKTKPKYEVSIKELKPFFDSFEEYGLQEDNVLHCFIIYSFLIYHGIQRLKEMDGKDLQQTIDFTLENLKFKSEEK